MNVRWPVEYDVDELPGLGWVRIFWQGEENTYFVLQDGSIGLVKAQGVPVQGHDVAYDSGGGTQLCPEEA